MTVREETRQQRYNKKRKISKTYPISLCAINFRIDDNLGYLIRSSACFGAEAVNVIGSIPARKEIYNSSGSTYDYVNLKQFKTPSDFIQEMKKTKTRLVSAELTPDSKSIHDFTYDFTNKVCIVVGNEASGIPQEILNVSEKVYIPMPGIGFCLNTSQTANIMLHEAVQQYEKRNHV
tara:strand:- start:737 stop:1267 length:531 start_codon:yes stop_codon:yes gene_type:complete